MLIFRSCNQFDLFKMPTSVTGILKGYDQLLNLVLDEVQEEILGG